MNKVRGLRARRVRSPSWDVSNFMSRSEAYTIFKNYYIHAAYVHVCVKNKKSLAEWGFLDLLHQDEDDHRNYQEINENTDEVPY